MSAGPGPPLEQIRATERETAQRLQAAQAQAQATVDAARREAQELVASARRRGQAASRTRYEEVIQIAQREADRLEAQAESRAASIRASAQPQLPALVDAMVELILAPPTERGT